MNQTEIVSIHSFAWISCVLEERGEASFRQKVLRPFAFQKDEENSYSSPFLLFSWKKSNKSSRLKILWTQNYRSLSACATLAGALRFNQENKITKLLRGRSGGSCQWISFLFCSPNNLMSFYRTKRIIEITRRSRSLKIYHFTKQRVGPSDC